MIIDVKLNSCLSTVNNNYLLGDDAGTNTIVCYQPVEMAKRKTRL